MDGWVMVAESDNYVRAGSAGAGRKMIIQVLLVLGWSQPFVFWSLVSWSLIVRRTMQQQQQQSGGIHSMYVLETFKMISTYAPDTRSPRDVFTAVAVIFRTRTLALLETKLGRAGDSRSRRNGK